jgi:hypothetical protein
MTDWANTNYDKFIGGRRCEYKLNGVLHRLDGPAVTLSDQYCYYYAGSLHRVDGTAMRWVNGLNEMQESWFCHGVKSTKEFVELMESFKTRLNTIEAELAVYKNNAVVYETFVDTLKNALDDTQSDEVVVSRKVIDAITECVKN